MTTTESEFKRNADKYSALAEKEDIHIMRDGKSTLCSYREKMLGEVLEAMYGTIPLNEETKNITVADIRAERRRRYE